MCAKQSATDNPPCILFIHGFGGNTREFDATKRYLAERGYTRFSDFSYKEKTGRVGMDTLAEQLHEHLTQLPEKRLDIVGFSMGGIIAARYLQRYHDKDVRTLVTISTPFQGTLTAYLSRRPGFLDLRPGSALLNDVNTFLSTGTIRVCAAYTPFDLMVIPGWNAKPTDGNARRIPALLHPQMFSMGRTWKFIRESLEYGRTKRKKPAR